MEIETPIHPRNNLFPIYTVKHVLEDGLALKYFASCVLS
jgi:hypothetical protein